MRINYINGIITNVTVTTLCIYDQLYTYEVYKSILNL